MKTWKAAVYQSVNTWSDGGAELSLTEQTKISRDYMRLHPDLHKVKTYSERNYGQKKGILLDELLTEIEKRHVDCIVLPSIMVFTDSSHEALFLMKNVLVPAGVRVIAVREEIDTNTDGILKTADYIRAMRAGKIVRNLAKQ